VSALLLWLSLFLAGDAPTLLGSEDWPTREAATSRLARLGVLALPTLDHCTDPEAHHRAGMLRENAVAPWHRPGVQLLACWICCGPGVVRADDPTWYAVRLDDELRLELLHVARIGNWWTNLEDSSDTYHDQWLLIRFQDHETDTHWSEAVEQGLDVIRRRAWVDRYGAPPPLQIQGRQK
jgi:hypothetical protein